MIQLRALVLSLNINISSLSRPISSHSMSDSHGVIVISRNSSTLFSALFLCANNTGFSLSLQPLHPWVKHLSPKGRESENPIYVRFLSTSPFMEMPLCACSSRMFQSITSSISSLDNHNRCLIFFSFIEARQSQNPDRK